MTQNQMNESVREWLEAKAIIKKFLIELGIKQTEEQLDHNTSALIARLAHNNPPLLIIYAHNMKE